MSKKDLQKGEIKTIYETIRQIIEEARSTAYRAVNFAMVKAYWQIGKVIVDEEQEGRERAEYGRFLIKQLSERLTKEFGKGFIERNLWYIRDFYLKFLKMNSLR